MKTIIWAIFGLLAIIWTGVIAISLKLAHWLLGGLGDMQVPVPATPPPSAPTPDWVPPWVDPDWLHAAQAGVADAMNHLNHALPMLSGLSGWVTLLAWFAWSVIMTLLLVTALVAHWLAGRDWGGPKAQAQGPRPEA